MPCRDPERQRGHNRASYGRHSRRVYERVRRRKQELVEWLRSLRVRCTRCPETHPACLDFHHRDPDQKEFSVTKAAMRGWSRERIAIEIAKCDVLCSNCHRKEHWDNLARVAQLDNAPGYEPGDSAGSNPAASTNQLSGCGVEAASEGATLKERVRFSSSAPVRTAGRSVRRTPAKRAVAGSIPAPCSMGA
jgi:hypothetical protein